MSGEHKKICILFCAIALGCVMALPAPAADAQPLETAQNTPAPTAASSESTIEENETPQGAADGLPLTAKSENTAPEILTSTMCVVGGAAALGYGMARRKKKGKV